jgi:folate-binding protein YgfZ
VVFKNNPEDIVLLCSASVLATTLKRLQMFVMRAQCKLTDASAEFAVQGWAQQGQLQQGAQEAGLGEPANTPNLIASYAEFPWAIARNGEIITLRLPDGHHAGRSVPRALRIAPKSTPTPAQMLHAQEAADGDSADLAVWQYLEVTAGIASVTAPLAEAFVPQMLNYESVGGVNFKKGCYPGQEVVARSQFRGTLKRRAYIVASAAPLAAGQEVFDSRDTTQPCGMVVNAAPDFGALETLGSLNAAQPVTNAGHWLAIVSMQTSAFDSPQLFAAPYVPSVPSLPATSAATLAAPALADLAPPSPANGTALTLRALPYALLDDI